MGSSILSEDQRLQVQLLLEGDLLDRDGKEQVINIFSNAIARGCPDYDQEIKQQQILAEISENYHQRGIKDHLAQVIRSTTLL